MAVLVNKDSRIVVQGLTGAAGSFHAAQCKAYGTKVVAGAVPGKGGTNHEGVPVFDTVEQAVRETGADVSMVFVPPAFAGDAVIEAASAGVKLVVCIEPSTKIVPSATAAFAWCTGFGSGGPSDHVHAVVSNTRTEGTTAIDASKPPST